MNIKHAEPTTTIRADPREMKNEENGAGVEVVEILNDLTHGHGSGHDDNQNTIDLNGVEIDEMI
jgi:hypothetical protein